MVHLDYRDARPIYSQIIDGFRDQILAGLLSPGDKLPSVRDLAAELAINPNTIQRSYRELESQGWIQSVPGKGSFAAGHSDADAARREELAEQLRQRQEEYDALVKTAIITYCKVRFGLPEDAERLKESYDEQKAQLSNASGYTTWEVSRNV